MNIKQLLRTLPWLLLAPIAAPAADSGGISTGLWLGQATIQSINEVQPRVPDLGFDLALTGIRVSGSLVEKGAEWRYKDNGIEPVMDVLGYEWDWRVDYLDLNNLCYYYHFSSPYYCKQWEWKSDTAPLGYDQRESPVSLETPLGFGYSDYKHRTTWFRHTFTVGNPDLYDDLRLQLWRNDGVVVYLNGTELFRNNLSSNYLDADSLASRGIADDGFVEVLLPADLLQAGDNVLAAEVHIAADNDQTLWFDAALRGVLSESAEQVLIPAEAGKAEGSDPTDYWQYLRDDEAAPDGWQDAAYCGDDSWASGPAKFGYGDGDGDGDYYGTELSWDSDANAGPPPVAYFRKCFDAPAIPTHLRFELLADDGAVVYVNGAEVYRVNMPAGDLDDASAPIETRGAGDEGSYQVHEVAVADLPAPLTATGNRVAVAVYQHPAELAASAATAADADESSTGTSFPLRVLLHVDAGGKVRLLKEATLMRDKSNNETVVVADHAKLGSYSGVSSRGGESVGVRVSAIGFDFKDTAVACDGSLKCGFTLAADHPTNPFLHRYHPDHDNLNARYNGPADEVYAVTRAIQIGLASVYPPGAAEGKQWSTSPPGWGDSLLGGTYSETFTGLHRNPITVSGPLMLQRLSTAAKLVQ